MSSYVWALTAFIIGRSATMSDEFILSKIDPYTTTEATMKRGLWWKAGRLPRAVVDPRVWWRSTTTSSWA